MRKYWLLVFLLLFPSVAWSWTGNYPVGREWLKLTGEGKKMYLEGISDGTEVAETFLVEELKYPLKEVMIKKYGNLKATPVNITAKVLPLVVNNNYDELVSSVDEFFKDPRHENMTVTEALKEIKVGEKITVLVPIK